MPRRGARNEAMWAHTPPRLNAAELLANPSARSAGGELWEGLLRWCLPNVHTHIRRPGAFDATAQARAVEARAAWRRRHHRTTNSPRSCRGHGSSPPQRAPPPGSHLREIQVRDARGCPLDFTALPLRAPTSAGARLGAAKKGAVMQPAARHCRCATGCVNKKRGPTPSRAPQHLTTHGVHASLGPKNMQNEFRAHAHAINSVCSSAVRLWHAS